MNRDIAVEMMNDVFATAVAQCFHETYEKLAPEMGYKTRDASAVPWEDVPYENKNLMVATVKHVMRKMELS